jgi:hypothetical protein
MKQENPQRRHAVLPAVDIGSYSIQKILANLQKIVLLIPATLAIRQKSLLVNLMWFSAYNLQGWR